MDDGFDSNKSCIVGLRMVGGRQELIDWVNAPMSQMNQDFRIKALSRAFGLSEHYIRGYTDCTIPSMGPYLMKEIIKWIREYPNLQENDPHYESHYLSAVDTNGG